MAEKLGVAAPHRVVFAVEAELKPGNRAAASCSRVKCLSVVGSGRLSAAPVWRTGHTAYYSTVLV